MATTLETRQNTSPRFTSPHKRIKKIEKPTKRDYKAIVEAWTIQTDIIDQIKRAKGYGILDVVITPDMAMDLLTLNDMSQNRHIKTKTLEVYEGQMKTGKWKQKNGDTIGVTEGLKLVNGQKRLWAIYLSGIECRIFIVYGMDDDVFSYIDIGDNRTATDMTSINGYQGNERELAYIVKAILLFNEKSIVKGTVSSFDVPNFEVNNFEQKAPVMKRLAKELEMVKATWMESSNKFFTPAQWVFVFYILRTLPGMEDQARFFLDRFADGVDLKQTSPIRIVRNLFENDFKNILRGRHKARSNKASLTIKVKFLFEAWNKFIDNEKVSELTVNLEDPIILKPRWKAKNA